MNKDPGILCLKHCDTTVFGFSCPDECPVCHIKYSEASVLPYPFSRASQCPCSIVLKPTQGDYLRDYNGAHDLHIGVTDSKGLVYAYDEHGLRNGEESQWEQCLAVPVCSTYAQLLLIEEIWDTFLLKMKKDDTWKPERYSEDAFNCYTFVLHFLRNLKIERISDAAKDKTTFCQYILLPHTTSAAKYITVYRNVSKYDLSKNRFSEVPQEITGFYFLEKLDLYHNVLRSLPDNINKLQSLVYLDLSRNQLQWLPSGVCKLSALQVLLLSNNRLDRLPTDIGNLSSLAEIDLSANQLTTLPVSFGKLSTLRSLVARRNQLTSVPVEIAALRLERLDVSANHISSLPVELRVMSSLVIFDVRQNPLISPPSCLCARGKVHIFKYLENLAQHRKGVRISTDTLDGRSTGKRRQTLPGRVSCRTPDAEMFYSSAIPVPVSSASSTSLLTSTLGSLGLINGSMSSGQSTPSTLSPGTGESNTFEDALKQYKSLPHSEITTKRPDRLTGLVNSTETNNHIISQSMNHTQHTTHSNIIQLPSQEQRVEDKCGPIEHIQTYREYKEALKLQRWQPQDIYRKGSPESVNTPTTPSEKQMNSRDLQNQNHIESKQNPSPGDKKRDPKREAVISYVKSQLPNGHFSPKKQVKSSSEATLVKTSTGYVNNNGPQKIGAKVPGKLSPSRTLSFTMRREQEKAKEEALLIAQLRQSLESRLKLSLPTHELAAALQDGVVLCHLANHVRPRSVASVHVPSPGVPKLPLARCRKNVDNFMEACKRLGVPEESIKSLSESFEQTFQSDSSLGDAHHFDVKKHCENLVRVILELLDLEQSYDDETPQYSSSPCSGPLSTFFFLCTFVASMLILYLIPDEIII